MPLKVKDGQVVKSGWSTDDFLLPLPSDKYTKQHVDRKTAWWQQYATSLNTTAQAIWAQRDFSASVKEILALAKSIAPDVGSEDAAIGIANWLGGGGIYHGLLYSRPAWTDTDEYLEAAKISSEGTQGKYKLGNLLGSLKKANPAAHTYVMLKAAAKALKVKQADDSGYSFTNNPTVKKAADAASNLAKSVGDAAITVVDSASKTVNVLTNTASTAFSVAEFVSKNILWIVGGTVVIGGIVVWKNRNELAKLTGVAARAAVMKGR